MATTASQAIKHKSSALRRTATAIRNLAASRTNEDDRRMLIQAAVIVEAEASLTAQRAKQKAADEKRYDEAFRKAKPLAQKLVVSLPMDTTAQQLAVLHEGYNGGYMMRMIRGEYPGKDATPAAMQRELTEALNEIAGTLAHYAARDGEAPQITETLLLRLSLKSQRPEIVKAARQFDRANAKKAA